MRKKWGELRQGRAMLFLAWFQGIYYAVAGIWPILHIDSFMMVTGPKTDILAGAHSVASAGGRGRSSLPGGVSTQRLTLEMIVLAVGAALALTAIELVYTWRGVISMVYLLNAAIETPLIAGWLWLGFSSTKGDKQG